jgi:flavin reductase (DIM6/NTAB) family NADH-FMN oxidoreductase RutF
MDAYSYDWPREDWCHQRYWSLEPAGVFRVRTLPESLDELRQDSRWPAFFPSPMCLVSTTDGRQSALEKVVAPSIVNRFPYVMVLSFCRQHLSSRHHARDRFMTMLEQDGHAAVQFLPPGPSLDGVMQAIMTSSQDAASQRLAAAGLPTSKAISNGCRVFDAAFLVYEVSLARATRDIHGRCIYDRPWLDVGSHRLYFLEINAIQLRDDIARGESQIRWRSLPSWEPTAEAVPAIAPNAAILKRLAYQKGFTADYAFPAANTVAFAADHSHNGRAVLHLAPLAEDQVEIDNDRARWPCFFPSSVGMITCQTGDGRANLMPCGSTTVVSRHPLVIAPAVSYAAINQRYAMRASLDMIRAAKRFGCGVPFVSERVLSAIRYAGNVSFAQDPDKIANAGLSVDTLTPTPRLAELPIHYDCELVGEVRLGTHYLLLGEVRRISVRADVTPRHPLRWVPWANVAPVLAKEKCA